MDIRILFRQLSIVIWLIILYSCNVKDFRRDRYFQKGNDALDERKLQQAMQFYDRVLEIDPDFSDAWNNKGIIFYSMSKFVDAVLCYDRAIQTNPDLIETYFNRANAFYELGKINQAKNDLIITENIYQDSTSFHFLKGLILYDLKEYKNSIDEFSYVLMNTPDNPEVYVNLATNYLYLDSLDRSESLIVQALHIDSSLADAYNVSCQIHIRKGKYAVAEKLIEKALKLDPDNPYFLNNRGFLRLMTNHPEEAVLDIDRSIELDPDNPWSYRNKGIWYIEKGKYSDALRVLSQSYNMDKNLDEIDYYLGLVYFNLNDKESACDAWERSIEKGERRSINTYNDYCRDFSDN
ncbi:tetratricopeptide repeat protein [Bacteroidota bacterium]